MPPLPFQKHRLWTVGLLGFTALTSQMVFMRELAGVFYGNELSLGALFAVWLLWTAAGSGILPKRFPVSRGDFGRLRFLFFALALAIPATDLGIRLSRTVLGAAPGEIVGFGPMLSTGLVLFAPFCLLSGYAYTAACRVFRGTAERETASVSGVYALESFGAAAGGLLTSLVLFPGAPNVRIIALLSSIAALAGLFQPVGKNPLKKPLGPLILGAALTVFFFAPGIQSGLDGFFWRNGTLLTSGNTPYGNLAAARMEGEISFFENGLRLFTCPDPLTAEESVHYALLEHPAPEKILLVGGSLGGTIREAFMHPSLKAVHAVELDPETVRLAGRLLPEEDRRILEDPRVTFHLTDARRFIRTTEETFDAVLLNLPNPYTIQLNRYYTREFFLEVRARMKPRGVFSFALPSSENAIGEELADFLGTISATLSSVFPHTVLLPGDNCRFIASMDGEFLTSDPAVLAARVRQRGLNTSYVREYYLPYQFSKERMDYLSSRLTRVPSGRINRDLKPAAFWFDFILWSRHFASPLTAETLEWFSRMRMRHGFALLLLSALSAWIWIRRSRSTLPPVRLSLFCLGLSGISIELVILLAYQTIYGVLYQDMAVIVAGFMAGLGIGSTFALKVKRPDPSAASKRLAFFQLLIGLFTAALAGLFMVSGGSWGPPIPGLIWFSVLDGLAGFLAGAAFMTANDLFFSIAAGTRDAAGKLYAIDLLGSLAGALLTAALAIPLMGFQKTLFFISSINLAVFCILLISKKRASV
jgi:spermidine synthase